MRCLLHRLRSSSDAIISLSLSHSHSLIATHSIPFICLVCPGVVLSRLQGSGRWRYPQQRDREVSEGFTPHRAVSLETHLKAQEKKMGRFKAFGFTILLLSPLSLYINSYSSCLLFPGWYEHTISSEPHNPCLDLSWIVS